MERQHELHPHLGREALNKAVQDGVIPGGIMLEQKNEDTADQIGRGTKPRISRKRKKTKAIRVIQPKFSLTSSLEEMEA